MKRVNYHLTELQIKQLKELSNKTGLSVADIIRRAIDEYITTHILDYVGYFTKEKF